MSIIVLALAMTASLHTVDRYESSVIQDQPVLRRFNLRLILRTTDRPPEENLAYGPCLLLETVVVGAVRPSVYTSTVDSGDNSP